MPSFYQPRVNDKDHKIRKTVEMIRKKTKLDKSFIVERMFAYSVDNVGVIFPQNEPQQREQ